MGGSLEQFEGADPDLTFDGIISADFALFTFGNKKSNIASSAAFIPILNQWGRIRIALTAQARQEVFHNFYLSLGITENYDSQPPTPDTNKNALTPTTSIGWSF